MRTDLPTDYDTGYAEPSTLTIGPGQKSYDISKEQVEHVLSYT